MQKYPMPTRPDPLPIAATPVVEPALASLYLAAIGPLASKYYWPVFDRFETLGRPRSSWNWAPALLTLNWLLFRQLWWHAAIYLATLLSVPLGVLVVARLLLALPAPVEAGLWLTLLALLVVLPGLWGNALYFKHCQQRIGQALAASATLEQACDWLRLRAPQRRHLWLLGAGNAALAMLVGLISLNWPDSPTPDFASDALPHVQGKAATPLAASAPVPAPAPASAPASASTVGSMPGTGGTSVLAAAPTSSTASAAPAGVSAAATAASERLAASASPRASATAASSPGAAASALEAGQPTPSGLSLVPGVTLQRATGQTRAVTRSERDAADARAAAASTAISAARTAPASPPASRASVSTAAGVGTPKPGASKPLAKPAAPVYVNVGLFADPDNARRAYATLVKAGLPAERERLKSASAERTRVRAGPFADRAQARAAAERIRALQLDAVLTP